MQAGLRHELYDEALRDLLLSEPPGTFGFEDVTGLPWIEIDFVEDVERARAQVLPRLVEPREAIALAAGEPAAGRGGGRP